MKCLVIATSLVLAACGAPSRGTTSDLAETSSTVSISGSTTTPPSSTPPETAAPTRLDHFVEEASYGPGIVEIYGPGRPGNWPVLVLFHGGAWVTGTVRDTAGLANELAAKGVVVFNASYRTMSEGGSFPTMVDDVACAFAYARSRMKDLTGAERPVVIAGHSAGAHLAALVALRPGEFGAGCPSSIGAGPDGFVGLAGPYDISGLASVLTPFFGVEQSQDPELWARGNPMDQVAGTTLPILLIHGSDDQLVPVSVARTFAEALTTAGDPPRLEILQGEDHSGVAEPVVVDDLILDFLDSLPS